MVWSGGWEGLQQCKVAEGEDRAPFPFPHPPQASSACRALAGPLLFTNIDVGVGSYATFSTGPRTSGPSSQSNTTYWNIRRGRCQLPASFCWPASACAACREQQQHVPQLHMCYQPPPASACRRVHVGLSCSPCLTGVLNCLLAALPPCRCAAASSRLSRPSTTAAGWAAVCTGRA